MAVMSGAEALVRSLSAHEIEVVFTLPGAQIMYAFEAFYQHRKIRLITTRHEQATTYMADGYARVSGKPGVAFVVPGPGVLNAAAGIGTAYACSSPVLLLAGQIDSPSLGKRIGRLHEIEDQRDVFKPITKWSHRVRAVKDIPAAIDQAMVQLRSGRPRPVELEVPYDIFEAKDNIDIPRTEAYPKKQPDAKAVDDAANVLSAAQSPVIVAGGGAVISGSSKELLDLAEFLQAPVVTTPEGKGVIPEDSYLSLLGGWGGVWPIKKVLDKSDVIVAIGTRLSMHDFAIAPSQKLIQIDIDSSEIGKLWAAHVGIEADAKEALTSLYHRLRTGKPRTSRENELRLLRQRARDDLKSVGPEQVSVVDTIRHELPDDAILVSGMTIMGYWSHLAYSVRKPKTYFTTSYFGTLGSELPMALGAKLAAPNTPVVALVGDGGFMYTAQELSTAMQYGINVVIILFNDGAYGASKYKQRVGFDGRYIGTDLCNPDFVKFAESFGAVGLRTKPQELGITLRKALQLNQPVLLEVIVPTMEPPYEARRRLG